MIEVAPADRECGAAPIVTEEVRSFIDVQFPSPSLFDTPLSIPGFDDNEVLEDGAISTPPLEEPEDASQEVDTWNWPESERIHLPPIERWEDLACIRTLDRFYGRGGLGERSYQILYRMCQIIWAIGNEVEIRNSKKVKLPRAERLAKFRRYCDALLEGVQLFKNNMKAQMNHVRESTSNLPVLHNVKAYQDLRPKLDEWHANIMTLYKPCHGDARVFKRILDHYSDNYDVLYSLHREKPDYGLSKILPTATKVFKIMLKLPSYAVKADELVQDLELYFWQNVDRHDQDRKRQEREYSELFTMPQEQRDVCFENYIYRYQPDFIRDFHSRRGTINVMRESEMEGRMRGFEGDFLEKARGMIKDGTWNGNCTPLDKDELVSMQQAVQEEREEDEAIGGWMTALGLEDGGGCQLQGDLAPKVDTERSHEHLFHGAIANGYGDNNGNEEGSASTTMSKASDSRMPLSPALLVELPDEIAKCANCSSSAGQQVRSPQPALLHPADATAQSDETVEQGHMTNFSFPLHISKSFAVVEDELATRCHCRSSTAPETSYTTDAFDLSNSPRPAKSFHGRATGSRRHGVHVPRIFTGSFSELETEIRRMQLHKVKTPEDQPGLTHPEGLKVRDFAVSPSPCPSPVTLLFRREALLSRETELQHRVINGEVIRTRRPSTKTRALTVDERTGGLEAWLAKDEARADSPTLAVPTPPRPERKNTL